MRRQGLRSTGSGHLNNVTGEGVEHASFIEQPVHGIGGGGVELAEHDHGMAEQLGQRQRRHIEHDPCRLRDGDLGHHGLIAANQRSQRGGVKNLAPDHAADSAATG
jgi:hypothetical protein